MDVPKFILGDNSDYPNTIYVIHTEFPRCILNIENDAVTWLENFDNHDEQELFTETLDLVKQANEFYNREISRYKE